MRTLLCSAALIVLAVIASSSVEAQSRSRALTSRARTPQTAIVSRPTIQDGNPAVKELADLVIAKVSPDADGQPPQTVTILNQGGTTARGFTIRVRANNGYNDLLYQIEIPVRGSLAPGASRTFQLFTTNAGLSWSILADSHQQVRESNEQNNFWANNRLR
mgnify:CR=1 FL=1